MALKRRTVFPNRAAALGSYSKRGFRTFHPAALRAYVDHGFRELYGQCMVLNKAVIVSHYKLSRIALDRVIECATPALKVPEMIAGQEGWALKCDVLGEAFVYENVLPMGDPFWSGVSRLSCPVTVGLGDVRGAAMQGSKAYAEAVAAECKHAKLRRWVCLELVA